MCQLLGALSGPENPCRYSVGSSGSRIRLLPWRRPLPPACPPTSTTLATPLIVHHNVPMDKECNQVFKRNIIVGCLLVDNHESWYHETQCVPCMHKFVLSLINHKLCICTCIIYTFIKLYISTRAKMSFSWSKTWYFIQNDLNIAT